MSEGGLAALLLADTVALNAGVVMAVGALASVVWLLRGGRSPWALGMAAPLRTALQAALVFTALASLGALWLQAAAMAETPLSQALPAVATVLGQSHYGRAWLTGAVGLALAFTAACLPLRLPTARRDALAGRAGLGIAIFACSRSLVGHAAAHGDMTWAVAVDTLHLLLAALWTGAVFMSAWVFPVACSAADRTDRARWVKALSSTATLALAGVVLTGTFNAWRGAGGSVGRLAGTPYGTVLWIKLGLVGAAVLLGSANRFFVMPRLLEALRSPSLAVEPPLLRFVRILRVESVVLLVVLAAAAVLAASPPPGDA